MASSKSQITKPSLRNELIPHLFLLKELPLHPIGVEEFDLIDIIKFVLGSIIATETDSLSAIIECTRRAFHKWSEIQAGGSLQTEKFTSAVSALKEKDDYLPLFVRSQNAGLLFSVCPPQTELQGSHSNSEDLKIPVIGEHNRISISVSTFRASLPSGKILEAQGELTYNYPCSSLIVDRSPLLLSTAFAEQLNHLHTFLIDEAATKTHKASAILTEVCYLFS